MLTHGPWGEGECSINKAVYTATEVACGWAGAVIKKAIQVIGQEQ